jgi:hypothetical protein
MGVEICHFWHHASVIAVSSSMLPAPQFEVQQRPNPRNVAPGNDGAENPRHGHFRLASMMHRPSREQ